MADDRPQDVGRSHKRGRGRGSPPAATATLLARYHDVMRRQLAQALDELEPPPPTGTLELGGPPPAPDVPITRRSQLVDLAIKIARELGTSIEPPDPSPPTSSDAPARAPRGRRIDYGGR